MVQGDSVTDLQAIRQHWDERAKLGPTAGTQDLILKQLEQRAILAALPEATRVLEIGCGRGEMARLVAARRPVVWAIDSSPEMVEAAALEYSNPPNVTFALGDALDPPFRQWDVIYTQRCLINLPTWELQKQAIDAIADRLVPGGKFLMCEHSFDSLNVLNDARDRYGLSVIEAPWHNRYVRDAELATVTSLRLMGWHPFSATYYFYSRVLNAIFANEHLGEPEYDSAINRLALGELPVQQQARSSFSQGRLWVWEKP